MASMLRHSCPRSQAGRALQQLRRGPRHLCSLHCRCPLGGREPGRHGDDQLGGCWQVLGSRLQQVLQQEAADLGGGHRPAPACQAGPCQPLMAG